MLRVEDQLEGLPRGVQQRRVAEAREKEGVNATMIFVPPPFAADAIMEAADQTNSPPANASKNVPRADPTEDAAS